jgi:N-terminal domain of anti-restriction factor ArdC
MANSQPTERHEEIQFRQLLDEAVSKPGTLMRAYSLFWNYSLGNQILALIQANRRGIALGPIASFNRWKEVGRHVKRGEKAIELCMPVTSKRTVTEQAEDGTSVETDIVFKRFVFRRNWFMLSQTDGQEYKAPAIPAWDRTRALSALNVEEIPFEILNGNCQGYAKGRQDRH